MARISVNKPHEEDRLRAREMQPEARGVIARSPSSESGYGLASRISEDAPVTEPNVPRDSDSDELLPLRLGESSRCIQACRFLFEFSGAAAREIKLELLRHMRHQERVQARLSRRDALRADSDHRALQAMPSAGRRSTHSEPTYCSYRSRASTLSVTTTGRLRPARGWTSPPPPEPALLA